MDADPNDPKAVLHASLRSQRAALRLKLDGLSERDARMPRTPTGTNLLGLLKHCASIEAGYFGPVFHRPPDFPLPWDIEGSSRGENDDMYAGDGESMADVLDFCERCFAHADAVIEELPLDAPGRVPWWPEDRRQVTLGRIMQHVAIDEARHAGHADILREQIDGATGLHGPGNNLPALTPEQWAEHVSMLRAIAERR